LKSGAKVSVNKDYLSSMEAIGSDWNDVYVERGATSLFRASECVRLGPGSRANLVGRVEHDPHRLVDGWDKFFDETGQPYERTLRTIEAFLMTARKHNLPVQFNFFAFLPDVLAGTNPYLDPEAVRKQQTLISTVAARFHEVPWLIWI